MTPPATPQVKSSRPGILSRDLRSALGMGENTPPPWLINMQRYGPPPSYPDLKVAGLNAPIPPGAQFGYQPGGWGKPPVDENGDPLYGDVFGQYEEESDDEQVRPTTLDNNNPFGLENRVSKQWSRVSTRLPIPPF